MHRQGYQELRKLLDREKPRAIGLWWLWGPQWCQGPVTLGQLRQQLGAAAGCDETKPPAAQSWGTVLQTYKNVCTHVHGYITNWFLTTVIPHCELFFASIDHENHMLFMRSLSENHSCSYMKYCVSMDISTDMRAIHFFVFDRQKRQLHGFSAWNCTVPWQLALLRWLQRQARTRGAGGLVAAFQPAVDVSNCCHG